MEHPGSVSSLVHGTSPGNATARRMRVRSNGLETSRCRSSGPRVDTHAPQLVRTETLDEHASAGEGEAEGQADKGCKDPHMKLLSLSSPADARFDIDPAATAVRRKSLDVVTGMDRRRTCDVFVPDFCHDLIPAIFQLDEKDVYGL